MSVAEPATLTPPENLVVTHGPFWLTTTGVVLSGEPEYDQWEETFKWVQLVEGAVQFWLGDLLAIGESRWGEKYSQALAATGYAEQTLKNATWVAKHVPPEVRRDPEKVPFAHHAEVASLPVDEQIMWLDKVEEEQLTRDQLRAQIKQAKAGESGEIVEFWLVVKCTDPDDMEQLAEKLRMEGRAVKYR